MTKSEHKLFEAWFQEYKLSLHDVVKPAITPMNRNKALYLLFKPIDKRQSNVVLSFMSRLNGMYFFMHILDRLLDEIKNNTIGLNMNLEV